METLEDTRVPIPLWTLGELEVLVGQDPQDQLIDLRGLNKLREAGSALTIISALCSDHGWKVVRGVTLTDATKMDEEVSAIEAVSVPRLLLEMKGEDNQLKPIPDQRKAMQPLVEQVAGVRKMACNFGPSLVSTVDTLFNFVDNLYNNLPITDMHIKEIASLLQGVRDSSIVMPATTLSLAMDLDDLSNKLAKVTEEAAKIGEKLQDYLRARDGEGKRQHEEVGDEGKEGENKKVRVEEAGSEP